MRAIDAGLSLCLDCHQVMRSAPKGARLHCQRCGAQVWVRRPHSLARSWALWFTALILYIPANLLPIMTVSSLGHGQPDTILSGVVTLVQLGMWPIALVVFVASIIVPSVKLLGIAMLLVSVQRQWDTSSHSRLSMYRFIEWIGRWSMLDIFVIALLVALVNLGHLATIEAGPGAVAFSGVVILTMFAALAFDPRLIGDRGLTR